MSASNSPVGHHTSHTMGNGASSSSSCGVLGDASHPIGHHTSHTMGNGAASGSSGASQCGGSTFNGQPQGTVETSVTRPPTTVEQFISSIRDNMTETGEDDEPAVLKQVPSLVSLADSISRDSYVSDAGIDTVATSMFSTGNTANFSIIDTTLREGEQFATAFFTTEEKLQIARALDDIGVEYIEVTSPAASEKSRTDCEAICKLGLKAKILCHIRCHMDDARIAVQTGVDGINMCIGTSPQLMKHSHGKDMSFIAAKAQEIVDFVRSNNIEVRFSGEDSFRSDFNDILNLYSLVDSLGANRVGIADTVGGATAREVYEKISKLRSTVGCDIETHFHNDTGCAVSNALTALEAGATHIDTTVLGIGERNGITPLGALMMALMPFEREHILSKYNVEKLPELERLVAKLVGVEIPFNTPVIPTDI